MALTKDELRAWLTKNGYKRDPYGNFKKEDEANGRTLRFKLNPLATRYEIKSPVDGRWIRLRSAYYKDLTVTPEGKLSGLKR